jgi:4-aminobutyrate aminotransferase/(S)-3-amino-2-methylpropionate transaminase
MACGSCANENAFKVATIYAASQNRVAEGRGLDDFSPDDTSSVMVNEAPGASEMVIMSFEGAFHGRTIGCLSATRSKDIHKLDVPALKWPVAPFPQLKYPLASYVEENKAEEDRCIVEVRDTIAAAASTGKQVAAIIVEPIQAEGGDRHATKHFFQELRTLTRETGVAMIVDEVQTGVVGSGTYWMHEQWELDHPPDIVTFSKKAQIAGYYYTNQMQMTLPFRIFNTWMGDPAKLLLLDAVNDTVEKEELVKGTVKAGEVLLTGLEALVQAYPEHFMDARGAGTLCAFNCSSMEQRTALMGEMRSRGVLLGACGSTAIRFRPPLVFSEHHAALVIDRLFDAAAALHSTSGSANNAGGVVDEGYQATDERIF